MPLRRPADLVRPHFLRPWLLSLPLLLLNACGGSAATSATESRPVQPAAGTGAAETGDGGGSPSSPGIRLPDPDDLALPQPGLLNAAWPPSRNFDLSRWKLTLPSAEEVQAVVLNSGYAYADVFFTDRRSGGLVFRCPNKARTTANSSYSRTELREMRVPDGPAHASANNWRMAEGGELTATLRIDRVSTTGEAKKVGRVVIGQIHGDDSEPIRLYFDKKPGEARGRLYARMDNAANSTDTQSPDIVGNGGDGGLALGELFSYRIRLQDRALSVEVRRLDGRLHLYETLIDPNFAGDKLYFKAGVYNQNNTGDSADYVQATFFALAARH